MIAGDGVYVVGGTQRSPRSVRDIGDDWYGYGGGVILRVAAQQVSPAFRYQSRAGTCLPTDPILFKSASLDGDALLACTQTEVLRLGLPGFEILNHLSLPFFNDVHHVVRSPTGSLLVAVSGLDLVAEVDDDGTVLSLYDVLDDTVTDEPIARISPDVDYRLGIDLKPHAAHPNHLFLLGGEPWATRFEQRDAVSLVDRSRRIDIGVERVHDGVLRDGCLYFTTVDGQIAIADAETLQLKSCVRLGSLAGDDALLGWCRGLLFGDDHAWVGFSRIRPTRLRQTVSWIRSGLTRSEPTRIARYSLPDWHCEAEIDLEPHGCNAVFSIIADPATG